MLYADYLDADGLRAKYRADPNVDISRIVDVDVIWAGGPLAACLPPGTVLDYVFASHVMEHIPDLVGWFAEIAAVLRPGGLVALAIPDKRFTFDLLRAPSRLGDLIDAHLQGLRRPAPWQVFDHHAHAVRLDDFRAAWEGRIDPAALAHHADAAIALQCAEQARAGAHLDVHCWVFTPRSLMQRLGELVALGLLPYRCHAFYETEPCAIEMLLVLERCPEGFDRAAAIASFADRGARGGGRNPDAGAHARGDAGRHAAVALLASDRAPAGDEPVPGRPLGLRSGRAHRSFGRTDLRCNKYRRRSKTACSRSGNVAVLAQPLPGKEQILSDRLTHLKRLEAESIHIIREVAAEFEKPVMLYSIGKDSSVMLHLALKAFHPVPASLPAAAHRHHLEVPRDDRFRDRWRANRARR